MKRAATMRQVEKAAKDRVPQLRPVPAPERQRLALVTALVHEVGDTDVVLLLGSARVQAALDASVHRSVIEGARDRRERVLVEEDEDGGLVVIGALRTQPTPGIDAAEAYSIKAKRISLEADEEVSLTAQTAAVVVRAIGEVETYAERILSRAEGIHKIVGRMLRLN
jgi:hypothetical protein